MASTAGGQILVASPMTRTEATDSATPKPSASPGSIRPAGIGRLRVRCMSASMIALPPHVQRARRTGGHGDAENRRECQHRMDMAWRQEQADQAGEHHQADHARLQQQQPVPPLGRPLRPSNPSVNARLQHGSHSELPSPEPRQLFEGVEGRRRADCPFQRRGTLTPVIIGHVTFEVNVRYTT